MKSRDSLIRLKRFHVDEKRRQVAQIEMMIAEFERLAADLDQQIRAEQERTGIHDVSHYAYPTFARAAMQRRDNLRTSTEELRTQLQDARDQLAEAFEDLKKFELLDERDSERERLVQAAREQATLDETALQMRRVMR
ncbi:MAG: flagellar export protein FliJ [Pseudomonadota bacterium]|nr:flagellar export protein FliJ [Pseudomonadota bacterium]